MTLYTKQISFQKWLSQGLFAAFLLLSCCCSINLNAQTCSGIVDVDIENNGDELCEDSPAVPVTGRLFVDPGVYDYTWSASNSSAVSFDITSGQVTVTAPGTQIQTNITPEQATAFSTIELTIVSASCSLTGAEPITIFPAVTASIGNGTLDNVCQNGSLQLDGIPAGGNGQYTHLWEVVSASPQPATAALILDNAASENPTLTPAAGASDGQTYTLRYTVATNDDNCNVASAEISITVRENAGSATLSSTNNTFEICPNEDAVMTLNISSSSTNPYTYSAVILNSATGENETVNGIPNGGDITFNPTETTTYTLISVQNQFGCAVNAASGSVEFIVDETRPTIAGATAQDVNADENCAATIPNLLDDVTVTDNCDANPTVTQSPAEGEAFTGGNAHNSTQDVTITATDANGNERTRVITLTLKDVTAPVFDACPTAGYTQNTDDGICAANVSFPQPAFTENCNGTIEVETNDEDVNISTSNGTTSAIFPLGNTQVTYTLTDDADASTTCTFTVTVLDDEIPTIVCPPSVVLDNDNNDCSADYSFDRPTGDDNCGGNITVSESNDNNVATSTNNNGVTSATFPKGITTLTYTVSDGVNDGVPCSFTVTVNDVQLPTISDCPDNQTVDAGSDCTTLVNWDLPSADDNCPDDLTFVATTDNGTAINPDGSGTFPLGVTNVTYTADDGSTTPQTCDFTITVEDDTDPIINCADNSNNIVLDTDGNCTASVPDLTGNLTNEEDNCPGTISIVQVPAAGSDFTATHGATQDVTITATDAAGNTSECVYTLELKDIEAPTIGNLCPAEAILIENTNNSCSRFYEMNTPQFSDNCDADLDITVVTDDPTVVLTENTQNGGSSYSGIFPGGTTLVTFTATDDAGLQAQCIFDVIVEDLQAPTINCPADQNLTANPGECGNNFTAPSATANDNCTNPTPVTHDFAGGASSTDASGFYPVGVTNVTWTATDDYGNMTSCVQTITVTDDEDPTLTCPLLIETVDVSADDACSSTIPNFIGDANGNGADENTITFGDNCDFTLLQSPAAGTAFGAAHNDEETVTVTITDASNNTATCDIRVRMRDEIAPTLSCPANVTVNNDAGECEGTMPNFIGDADGNGADPSLSFADNCAFELSQSVAAGSTFGDGNDEGHNYMETVTITITDDANNEATCDIIVTLIDNEAPVFNEGPIATTINVNTSASSVYDCSTEVPDRTNPAFYFRPANNNNDRVNHVSDNCTGFDGLTFTQDIPVGTVITEDTDLTVTATDAAGNSTDIIIRLILNDNEAPMIEAGTCPDDITVNTNLNSCSATVTWTDPSFTDNCDMNLGNPNTNVQFFTTTPFDPNGDPNREGTFNIGTTTLFYDAVDADGNARRCAFDITVVNPDWVVDFTPEGIVNSNPVNFQFTGMGAGTWTWSFGDGSFSNQENPTKTYANTGNYTVCLYINNCVNTQVCKTINVTQRPPQNSVAQSNDDLFGQTILADFYAEKRNGKVALNWETTSEYDLESFTLQASRDGVDFADLTDMAGEGDLNLASNYAHFDEYATEGYNFYRLRQNNMDGTFTYSDIVSAQLKSDAATLRLKAYPNPATDLLYVQLPENSDAEMLNIEIYNLQGQLVLQQFSNYENEELRLDLQDLATGNHILRVATNKKAFTQQIVVQK